MCLIMVILKKDDIFWQIKGGHRNSMFFKSTVLNRVVSGPAKAAAAAVTHLGLPARLASDSGVRATA